MKKNILLLATYLLSFSSLFAQNVLTNDTTIARNFLKKSISLYETGTFDSSKIYCQKASDLYFKFTQNPTINEKWPLALFFTCQNNMALIYFELEDFDQTNIISDSVIELSNITFGENNEYKAVAYQHKGLVSDYLGDYDKALEFNFKALDINKLLYGERHPYVADLIDNIGNTYVNMGKYNLALEYFNKSLSVKKEFYSEYDRHVIISYIHISLVLANLGEYDLSLENAQKSLNIALRLYEENHSLVYQSYNNIGMIYYYKGEFDLALEYFLKTSKVMQETIVDKTSDIAALYTNISQTYNALGEYKHGLEYIKEALKIDIELFGEKHLWVAIDYNNIGSVYQDMGNYDVALENHLKSLHIKKELFGEDHPDVAYSYFNIALLNEWKGLIDSAFIFYNKALIIFKAQLGEKHPNVALCYKNIGFLLYKEKKYDLALKNFQRGLVSDLRNFNDSSNINSNPILSHYLDPVYLIDLFYGKALTFHELGNYKESLINYRIADTLITELRKISTTKADKIALGESATEIYEGAIATCYKLVFESSNSSAKENFKNQAFYFSEKNKAGVLLEALAGQESLKFAGLPDNLLQLEHSLKVNITFFEKKLTEGLDSTSELECHDNLFKLNREYDELILKFEKEYPDYYNLKYASKSTKVEDIQKLLDNKTALRSYFLGDSTIYIFTLTKIKLDVFRAPKIKNLEDSIKYYRYGLTLTGPRMKEYYKRLGYSLYQQLFPDDIGEKIQNIIVVPDGSLGIIPFESLLTTNYSGDIGAYQDYPYLIKKYNISYSYSANLFAKTFPKDKTKNVEFTNLNDWLAFAPVFSDENKQGTVILSRELRNNLNQLKTDSIMTRGTMISGDYINPLPGTEQETQIIFNIFNQKNKKAQLLLYDKANENYLKSDNLNQYRVIHFATHGFVNSEKPELSGIILNQDTTGGEDGILYSGEFYNLRMNADLVVLSACETGLGKIRKGEGIIGLTRALLYAGAKNIVVSLWQVNDQSTSDLMIDFYKNLLDNQKQTFSKSLQQAKLKMISEGKYAHPFYWSPFILIGK